MTKKRIVGIGFVALAAFLAAGAIAWACTPSSYLYPVSPSSGQAGTQVVVRGGQFGTGPVELRWQTMDGRLLGTALGPEFTTKVTIPDKAEGVHYLVAVARDPADPSKVLAQRSEAFQITSGGNSSSKSASYLWSEARVPGTDTGIPAAAIAGTGLGVMAAAMLLFTAVLVRRRKATSL